MTDITANINNSNCIVRMTNIGHDTVTNICTAHITNIPWGTVDWISNIGGFILIFTILSAIFIVLPIIFYIMFREVK